ncbi:MAG: TrmH family RNA methyltransferase [Rhodothermales bacterium]
MRKLKHDEIPRPDPEAVRHLAKHPVCVVVDNVRSIYNVGSLFRTSDAALVEKIYLTGFTGTPEHRALRKTALGAEETVAWQHEPDVQAVVRRLRGEGYTIAVLEITDTPSRVSSLEPTHFPLCLVVGNEVSGVQDEVVALADLALEIPQYGAKQSLNVAVAYGVAVFGIVERYRALTERLGQATSEIAGKG